AAAVDYGDGSGLQTLRLERDGTFRLHHQYFAPGVYRVTVTVTDDDGGVGTDDFLVTAPGNGRAAPASREAAAALFSLRPPDQGEPWQGGGFGVPARFGFPTGRRPRGR